MAHERTRVIRDVAPAALRDLLDAPARASVAFVDGGGVELLPAVARFDGSAPAFAVAHAAAPELGGREVVLLVDDGRYWFELRGVSVRGPARPLDRVNARPLDTATDARVWYAIEVRRTLAWDYGTLREERDG